MVLGRPHWPCVDAVLWRRRRADVVSWQARLLVIVAVAAGATLAPSDAWAADTVVATSPADRAALADAPTEVDLRVSAEPDPGASHVTVFDAAGADLDIGRLSRVGEHDLRQAVAIGTTGNFTVAYHVVFTDGHDVVGAARFSVGTGVAPPVVTSAQQRADEAVAQRHDHDIDPVSGVFLVLDVLVVAAVALLLFSNPRRRRSAALRR